MGSLMFIYPIALENHIQIFNDPSHSHSISGKERERERGGGGQQQQHLTIVVCSQVTKDHKRYYQKLISAATKDYVHFTPIALCYFILLVNLLYNLYTRYFGHVNSCERGGKNTKQKQGYKASRKQQLPSQSDQRTWTRGIFFFFW